MLNTEKDGETLRRVYALLVRLGTEIAEIRRQLAAVREEMNERRTERE